ncbi:MAG: antitoxin [Acidimicrobiia bacterium]
MLNHRLQVLIDDDRYLRLRQESERVGVPIGEIVRRAIDHELPASGDVSRSAIARLLAARPMAVPDDPRDLDAEIRDARTG